MTAPDNRTLAELAEAAGLSTDDLAFLEAQETNSHHSGATTWIRTPEGRAVAFCPPGLADFVLHALSSAVALEGGVERQVAFNQHLHAQLAERADSAPQRFCATFVGANNAQIVDLANAAIGLDVGPMPGRAVAGIHGMQVQLVADVSQYPLGKWVAFVVYDTRPAIGAEEEGQG